MKPSYPQLPWPSLAGSTDVTVRRVLPAVVVFFRGGQLGVVSCRTRDVLIGEFSLSSSRMHVGAAGRRGVIERWIHKAGREQHGVDRLAGQGLVAGVLDIAGKWRSYRSLATGYLFSAASGWPQAPPAVPRKSQCGTFMLLGRPEDAITAITESAVPT